MEAIIPERDINNKTHLKYLYSSAVKRGTEVYYVQSWLHIEYQPAGMIHCTEAHLGPAGLSLTNTGHRVYVFGWECK